MRNTSLFWIFNIFYYLLNYNYGSFIMDFPKTETNTSLVFFTVTIGNYDFLKYTINQMNNGIQKKQLKLERNFV